MDQWISEQILSLHTSHYYDPECSYFGIIWSACVYYPISFFIGMRKGELVSIAKRCTTYQKEQERMLFYGCGPKKSGTPDCGRELPGGCPFLAILAKVKGKSFAVSALY